MFPKAWDPDLGLESQEAKMLAKVKAEYSVRLKPVEKVKRGSHMDEDSKCATTSQIVASLMLFASDMVRLVYKATRVQSHRVLESPEL